MSKPVLGRGLDALMRQVVTQSTRATQNSARPKDSGADDEKPIRQNMPADLASQEITQEPVNVDGAFESSFEISLDAIFPNRLQPRRTFNDESLQELSSSLKRDGMLQPLLVVKERDGYMLIAGERRLRAARLAGMSAAPARVLPPMDDATLLQLALIENIQREDLNPVEAALGYKQLMQQYGMSQTEMAERIGKSRSAIANSIRLLNLPQKIQDYLRDGKLSEGHARALLNLSDASEQLTVADQVINDSLSVRHVERETKRRKGRRLIPKHRDIDLIAAENDLKRRLGAPVRIKPGLKRGKIEIEYGGVDDLNRLLELLQTVRLM
jgi:ParB family transcriptional regulator, chromosome partitioning protein